jgi:hypothetical protein
MNMGDKEHKGEIIIYKAEDGQTAIDVRLQDETVWLTQDEMARLFKRERTVITKHINNVFATGELVEKSNVQKMHIAHSDKPIKYYNLDVIISVGYRMNSKRGTQFRIWATRVLREHLVKGFTVNDRRLKELHQAVHLITEYAERRDLSGDEAKALLHVVEDYTFALDLDDYDHQRIAVTAATEKSVIPVTYDEATRVIDRLRRQFHTSELFGREKDKSLYGSLDGIFQTFGGRDL